MLLKCSACCLAQLAASLENLMCTLGSRHQCPEGEDIQACRNVDKHRSSYSAQQQQKIISENLRSAAKGPFFIVASTLLRGELTFLIENISYLIDPIIILTFFDKRKK